MSAATALCADVAADSVACVPLRVALAAVFEALYAQEAHLSMALSRSWQVKMTVVAVSEASAAGIRDRAKHAARLLQSIASTLNHLWGSMQSY